MANQAPTIVPALTPRTVSLPDRKNRPAVRSLERAGLRAPYLVDLTVAGEPPSPPRRAAQYVRMSTEHQHYSIGYQSEAIRGYAQSHGFTVVRTYSDEARSGLTIGERPALRSLLADVVGKTAEFEAILVYDVSRWGRFQDSDEAAYYEFLCRREGLEVHYCAEPFRNDGTAVSSLIKNVKRMMAGEYSRELSEKMFAAKCQLVRMGHSAGSPAIFGYRRMLVDASGRKLCMLSPGDRKSLRTDRIILVPGPEEEVETVRWIFQQVADHATRPGILAAELNRRGVTWRPGKAWQSQRIQHLLSNEKYIGTTVYNRASMRLKTARVKNPPEEWIRVEGTHAAIVEPCVFWRAQDQMNTWSSRISNETALVKLRSLLEKEGRLSSDLIYATPGLPHPAFYRDRFGGLTRAYALVGYVPKRDYRFLAGHGGRRRQLQRLRDQVAGGLAERGLPIEREVPNVMHVGGWLRLGVQFAHYRPIKGAVRWYGQFHAQEKVDWMLFGLLNEVRSAVREYCLISGGISNFWLGGRHFTPGLREWYAESLDRQLDRIAALARGGQTERAQRIRRSRV